MTRRLLLTGAGTGTAFAYAHAIARCHPDVALVTADTNPAALVSAAVFSETHVRLPAVADAGFARALRDTLADQRITHYLPILDPEILLAARARASLGVAVLAPPAAFVEFAMDKQAYAEQLAVAGLQTPALLPRSGAALPCMAKTYGSFGGRGAWRIERAEDLAALPDDAFLQAWIDGPEFTVDCFPLGGGGRPFCSVRQRIEVKAGVCTKALIEPSEPLADIAARLVGAFGPQQPFCFQAIRRDGFWITDVNPRLGAGSAMSAANGADFFAAHLAQVFGGDPLTHLRAFHRRCVVTRQYVDYVSEAPCA